MRKCIKTINTLTALVPNKILVSIHFECRVNICVQMRTDVIDIDESAIGGNASAEGTGDESAEASSKQGVDVVLNSRLVEYTLSKKDYMTYIKEYMARLALHMFCDLLFGATMHVYYGAVPRRRPHHVLILSVCLSCAST